MLFFFSFSLRAWMDHLVPSRWNQVRLTSCSCWTCLQVISCYIFGILSLRILSMTSETTAAASKGITIRKSKLIAPPRKKGRTRFYDQLGPILFSLVCFFFNVYFLAIHFLTTLKTKNSQSRADKKKATLLRWSAVGMNEWRHVYAIIFQAAYTLGCIQQTDSCSCIYS